MATREQKIIKNVLVVCVLMKMLCVSQVTA